MNLSLDIDQYHDLLRLDGSPLAESVLKVAEEVIASGGVVKIEARYVNAPPELAAVITTKDGLARWRKEIRRVTQAVSDTEKKNGV